MICFATATLMQLLLAFHPSDLRASEGFLVILQNGQQTALYQRRKDNLWCPVRGIAA